MKKRIRLVFAILVGILLCTMTISDIYYSKLERDYPLLGQNELLKGEVTDFRVHWKYIYLELDSKTKRLIRPAKAQKAGLADLHDFIQIGDQIHYDNGTRLLSILREDKPYNFQQF